jgi:hypothetical protein
MATNKRTGPEIQARLREMAEEYGIDELAGLADELGRKSPVTRAKPRSAECTAELAEEIRQYRASHPDLHQRHIAEHFNVNPGRVSESLNGLR